MEPAATDQELFDQLEAGGRELLGNFPSLTEAQRLAIPEILARRPLLLIARTASGKTEAVLGPLLTLLKKERWVGRPSILHIAPTRALVNDLHRRLEVALGGYVEVGRRTGEYREVDVAGARHHARVARLDAGPGRERTGTSWPACGRW